MLQINHQKTKEWVEIDDEHMMKLIKLDLKLQ